MNEILDPNTAVMWFASKEMHRDKEVWEFTGKNEKSTVLVKLTANNQHGIKTRPLQLEPLVAYFMSLESVLHGLHEVYVMAKGHGFLCLDTGSMPRNSLHPCLLPLL